MKTKTTRVWLVENTPVVADTAYLAIALWNSHFDTTAEPDSVIAVGPDRHFDAIIEDK